MIKSIFKRFFGMKQSQLDQKASEIMTVQEPESISPSVRNVYGDKPPEEIKDCPRNLKTDEKRLYIFEDSRFIGPRPIAESGGEYLKTPAVDSYLSTHEFPTDYFFRDKVTSSVSTSLESAFVMYSRRIKGYSHWLIDNFPKIHWYQDYCEKTGTNPTILIPSELPEFGRQSLEVLGYDSDDWYSVGKEILEVEKLIVPSHYRRTTGGPFYYPAQSVLRWVGKKVRDNISENDEQNFSERIYISRKDAPKRNIRNEDEVISIVQDYGFENYQLSKFSFEDQVRMFANAECVIGGAGAGFINTMFSEPLDTLQIMNNIGQDFYLITVSEFGHRCDIFAAESIPEDDIRPLHQDVLVDTDEFRHAVEDFVSNLE